MDISLPVHLQEFVLAQVAKGAYTSPSEYVSELVRADRAQASLEAEVIKGLESGESTPMRPDEWNDLRKRIRNAATPQ